MADYSYLPIKILQAIATIHP